MAIKVQSIDRRRRSAQRQAAAQPKVESPLRPRPRLVPLREAATKRAPDPIDEIIDFGRRLLSAFNPAVIEAAQDEIAAKMRRIPTRLNSYGFDPWGFSPDIAAQALLITTLFYRYYFRVEVHGIENIPSGRVLVIGNHAGQVAIDAAMIGTATFLEGTPPRILRGMGEYWLPTVPFINVMMVRTGSVVGTPKNCIDLLHNDEAVIAFPEGVRGMNKLYRDAYKLQEFGLGFMRLAVGTNTPIVPVAVVGSEEQAPGIANVEWIARLLDMPAFPVTLTWPWLGPLGMIPFPVKYRIYFGKPMRFTGKPHDEDEIVERQVGKVKGTIQAMLDRGLRERRSVFF